MDLYRRGSVAITKDLQCGVDLIIPIMIVICKDYNTEIKESMMLFVLSQIKNIKEQDGGYPFTATALLTQKAAGIELDENLPYLSLYMNFGPHLGPGNKSIEMPMLRKIDTRSAAKLKGVQTCLAVFSLSENVYPVLRNSKTRSFLQKLAHFCIRVESAVLIR